MGRRRVIRRKRTREGERERSLFYPTPHHPRLAEIITIKSPSEARESIKKLRVLFDNGDRNDKLAILRAVVLTENRILAMLNRRDLSSKEWRELKKVYWVYHNFRRKIQREYDKLPKIAYF